jgi:hypothetical protein
MAIADVSAADQDAIGSFAQGIDHQIRVDHTRAHHAYDS